MLRSMYYNDSKGIKAMKKIKCGDIVVLKSGRTLEIEAIHGYATIVFRQGAIGKVINIFENWITGTIFDMEIEFSLFYGSAIRIRVKSDNVKHASRQQVERYRNYNNQ